MKNLLEAMYQTGSCANTQFGLEGIPIMHSDPRSFSVTHAYSWKISRKQFAPEYQSVSQKFRIDLIVFYNFRLSIHFSCTINIFKASEIRNIYLVAKV